MGTVFVNDRCRRVQPTVGSIMAKQVVLICIRRLAEYMLACKPTKKCFPPSFLLYLLVVK